MQKNQRSFKNPLIKRQNKHSISPTVVIVLSFALVILTGTLLLLLPFATRAGQQTDVLGSLFTATSATCVTGLVVYDTVTHWTPFGQAVILMLIQIGGIGLVTISAFFLMLIRRKTALRSMVITKESINTENLSSIRALLKLIVIFSFIVETVGALIFSIRFIPMFGFAKGLWYSIFTSVSAFCNAGFDLFGYPNQYSSLIKFADDPLVIFTVMILIVVGGLGFIVYDDLLRYRKDHKLMLHTKLVLVGTAVLIFGGTLLFLLNEYNNPGTIGKMPFGEKVMSSMFYSVTLRTAGFNSFDLAPLSVSSKIISCILMFIGAAPGSTAGGIKITTAIVLIGTVLSTIKNSGESVIIGRRNIDYRTVFKALTIAILGMTVAMITASVIYAENNISVADAAYQSFSAFGTVGVSSIITGDLGVWSKISIILTMFVGRVGPFSFFLALILKQARRKKTEVLPEGQIIVG